MLSFNKSPNDKAVGHVYAGLARLSRLLRNGRGTARLLAPVAIGGPLTPMENPTASQPTIGDAVPGEALIEDHDQLRLAVPFPQPDGTETVTSLNGTHATESLGEVGRGVTLSDFRRIALSMPETEESNGMGYPNFRTGRKSFATIEDTVAVIRLTRDQQAAFVVKAPEVFAPDSSGWGRLGNTVIRLQVTDEATVQVAVAAAWSNVAEVGHASDVVDTVENAAKLVKVAKVANEISVAAFPNTTGAAEVGDAAPVADKVSTAALVNARVVEIGNVAVNVEPRDPLLGVIERLQMFWGDEIKKGCIQ